MHQTNMMALAISIHAPPRGATDPRYTTITRTDDFNSRPSARGDAPERRGGTQLPDFNSRPSARGDQIAGTHTRRFPHFNSRPSARGDDSRTYEVKPELISIHAPPRGATRCAGTAARPTIFQFTPLREGRPGLELTATTVMHFNSRPSARGDATSRTRWLSAGFQFTPLREGRRRVLLGGRVEENISIHAPPRGATISRLFGCANDTLFQFTPLREGRHSDVVTLASTFSISIHAPPRGATYRRFLSFLALHISIHAPPRGATPPNQRHSRASCNFNSRPSARGDSLAARTRSHHVHFNSRPSARGDASVPNVLQFHIISIHAPPRGATER